MFTRREFLKGIGALPVLALGSFPLKYLWAQDRNWEELRDLIYDTGAELYLPGEGAYSTYNRLFNLRLRPQAAALLRGTSELAIQRAVEWCKTNEVPIHSRAGGHSYEGFSSGPGLVVDLSQFQNIDGDFPNRSWRVGSGVKLGKLVRALGASGAALPTGTCATVGIAGLTLGGGMGLSARQWGLTCDRLKSARVILADGSLVIASEEENQDLFWAIRGGGGGNFGVVTEFEFSPLRALDVYTFSLTWSASRLQSVLENWQAQLRNGSRQVTSILKLLGGTGGIGDVKIIGQVLSADNENAPTEAEARSLIAPYVVGSPTIRLQRRTFVEAAEYFAGGDDPPVRFKAKSSYAYEELSTDGIAEIQNQLSHVNQGTPVALMLDSYGGAIEDKATSDTAFFHRKALYSVQYYRQWSSDASTESSLALMRRIFQAVDPYFSGYSYPNYCDADLAEPLMRYYGDNLERLRQVKQALDPATLFRNALQNL